MSQLKQKNLPVLKRKGYFILVKTIGYVSGNIIWKLWSTHNYYKHHALEDVRVLEWGWKKDWHCKEQLWGTYILYDCKWMWWREKSTKLFILHSVKLEYFRTTLLILTIGIFPPLNIYLVHLWVDLLFVFQCPAGL